MEELKKFSFAESNSAVANAADRLQSPAILRALKICDKLIVNREARFLIFQSLALAFNESLTAKDIEEAITDANLFDLNISVENLRDAYMQCVPNKGRDANNTDPHSVIFNDKYLSYNAKDTTQSLRCTFLILVKALHEYSHTLTPSFARRTKAFRDGTDTDLNTPEKLGSIWRSQRSTASDAGSAWETLTFGGRVLTASVTGNYYAKPLQLMIIDDPAAAPTPANSTRADIEDSQIQSLLAKLEEWVEGSPLPDLSLLGSLAEEEEGAQPPLKKMRKSASESGGMHLKEYDMFEDFPVQATSASNASESTGGSGGVGAATSSQADTRSGGPHSSNDPVPLSEEVYEELVRVGQAMSPEMQRAWMTGNVKF